MATSRTWRSGSSFALLVTSALATSVEFDASRKLLATCGTQPYGQCGGLNCPANSPYQCADAATGCCPSGFTCLRQNPYYYQCLPGSSSPSPSGRAACCPASSSPPASPSHSPPPSPTTTTSTTGTTASCNGMAIPAWGQCGGESNCPSGMMCSDAKWPAGCCPSTFSCTRSSEWYWQCTPSTS
ncbi:hypothetical protein WJX84_006559 [Apatococcus fuscideae]|uniref:CBM1 domain-containing protein n=1 Tax=Apatococcus fuscideae TaxID=2026836 RepID=A0AAW1T855_9CHLO